jgi:hypothetical protein
MLELDYTGRCCNMFSLCLANSSLFSLKCILIWSVITPSLTPWSVDPPLFGMTPRRARHRRFVAHIAPQVVPRGTCHMRIDRGGVVPARLSRRHQIIYFTHVLSCFFPSGIIDSTDELNYF